MWDWILEDWFEGEVEGDGLVSGCFAGSEVGLDVCFHKAWDLVSHDCEWEVGGDECLVLKEVGDGLFKRAVVSVYFEVNDLV